MVPASVTLTSTTYFWALHQHEVAKVRGDRWFPSWLGGVQRIEHPDLKMVGDSDVAAGQV